MKKIILTLLILITVAVALAACTPVINDTPGTSSGANITDEKDPDEVFADTDKEFYSLVTREMPYTVKSQDENTIYIANKITVPSFVANDRINSPIAKKMNTVLNKAYERNDLVSDGMLDALNKAEQSLLESGGDISSMQLPWTLETSYSIVRNDGKALSVIENVYYYAGGIHPQSNIYTYNFDPKTGEQIKQVFFPEGDSKARDAIDKVVYNKLVEKYGSDEISYDYVTSSIVEQAVDSWYFTENGITVYFNAYDIAPFAAGTFEIELSKDELGEQAQRYFK